VNADRKRGKRRDPADAQALFPLHHQVYLVLRRRLLEGAYGEDEALPGEHRLAEAFSVSRVTIRRTLERLESEGLVKRRRGAGTFPGDAVGKARQTVPLGTLREHLDASGAERRSLTMVDHEMIAAPAYLNREPVTFGHQVLRIRRISFHGDEPAHFVTSYVPGDLGQEIDPESLGSTTVLSRLEAAGHRIGEVEVTVSATGADMDVAGYLRIPAGTPLLLQQRLTLDASGAPLEYFEALSRPEHYRYQFVYAEGETKLHSQRWLAPG
jgi:GntR family transcriptional regulator